MIALRSFVGARENCRRFGVDAARRASTSGSPAPATSRAHCRRPDGTIPALSDADTGDYTELLDARRAPARAATTSRAAGRPRELPRRRLLRPAQRRASRYLIFDCGPLGDGGHGHYDR